MYSTLPRLSGASTAAARALGFVLFPEAISEASHALLLANAHDHLRKMRYESGHWDGVISGFRETSAVRWTPAALEVFEGVYATIRTATDRPDCAFLPPHALDLQANRGVINAHVDHATASGDIVASLSLVSARTLLLTVADESERQRPLPPDVPARLSIEIPPRSLYVMFGTVRRCYAHAIGAGPERRVSIMIRDENAACE